MQMPFSPLPLQSPMPSSGGYSICRPRSLLQASDRPFRMLQREKESSEIETPAKNPWHPRSTLSHAFFPVPFLIVEEMTLVESLEGASPFSPVHSNPSHLSPPRKGAAPWHIPSVLGLASARSTDVPPKSPKPRAQCHQLLGANCGEWEGFPTLGYDLSTRQGALKTSRVTRIVGVV